jgi:hypothetical protein
MPIGAPPVAGAAETRVPEVALEATRGQTGPRGNLFGVTELRRSDGGALLVGDSVARQYDATGRTATSARFSSPALNCPHGTQGRCIEGLQT